MKEGQEGERKTMGKGKDEMGAKEMEDEGWQVVKRKFGCVE